MKTKLINGRSHRQLARLVGCYPQRMLPSFVSRCDSRLYLKSWQWDLHAQREAQEERPSFHLQFMDDQFGRDLTSSLYGRYLMMPRDWRMLARTLSMLPRPYDASKRTAALNISSVPNGNWTICRSSNEQIRIEGWGIGAHYFCHVSFNIACWLFVSQFPHVEPSVITDSSK